MAPNKTLAAQLYAEFKDLFPDNAVEYFVSYYDYYQPEAYIPSTDTYIEKDSSINDEIDKLRHSATHSLLTRRDVLVVASVSAIYGLGAPEHYGEMHAYLERAGRACATSCCASSSTCSTSATTSTSTAARSACAATWWRSSRSTRRSARCGSSSSATRSRASPRSTRCAASVLARPKKAMIYPASHYVATDATLRRAVAGIRDELQERLAEFRAAGQAARGAAARAAHALRPRDARGDGLLPRRRELLALARRPRRRPDAVHALRLLPGRPARRARREPRQRAADRRHVPRRPRAQGDAGRVRLPAAVGARQPAAALRRVGGARAAAHLRLGDAGRLRARALGRRGRRADHPARRG